MATDGTPTTLATPPSLLLSRRPWLRSRATATWRRRNSGESLTCLGLPARLGLFDKDGPRRLLPGCAADRDATAPPSARRGRCRPGRPVAHSVFLCRLRGPEPSPW